VIAAADGFFVVDVCVNDVVARAETVDLDCAERDFVAGEELRDFFVVLVDCADRIVGSGRVANCDDD